MRFSLQTLQTALALVVVAAQLSSAADGPDAISLSLELGKETAYPGASIPVTVTMRVAGCAVRNISYPRLSGTGVRCDFGPPRQSQEEASASPGVTVYRFSSSITASRPGKIAVGPATVQCEVLEAAEGRDSFFGGLTPRTVTLTSPVAELAVIPFPSTGRPSGFNGTVGHFTVTRTARPTAVRAGDPVTVETIIRGKGSLAGIACPPATSAGLTGYPPRRTVSGETVRCEQVVVPHLPSCRIPKASIAFFDPELGRFATAGTAAIPLDVVPAPATNPRPGTPPATPPSPPLATPSPPRASPPPHLTATVALSTATLLSLLLSRRLRRRASPEPPPPVNSRRLRRRAKPEPPLPANRESTAFLALESALTAGDAGAFYTALFRAVQLHLGERRDLPAPTIASAFPEQHTEGLILARCHRVRYGKCPADRGDMAKDLELFRTLLRSAAPPK